MQKEHVTSYIERVENYFTDPYAENVWERRISVSIRKMSELIAGAKYPVESIALWMVEDYIQKRVANGWIYDNWRGMRVMEGSILFWQVNPSLTPKRLFNGICDVYPGNPLHFRDF